MKTETFEIPEITDETPAIAAEALALIESLGLTGQKPQIHDTTTTVRCPYRI